MDESTLQAIAQMAETITSIGVLLLWVWAERRDNESLFKIIEQLTALRLKQIENEEDDKEAIKIASSWRDKNQ
jgi:hypothetical protein